MYKCKTNIEYCQYLSPLFKRYEDEYIKLFWKDRKRKTQKTFITRALNYIFVNFLYILSNEEREGVIYLNSNLYDENIINGKRESVIVSYSYVRNVLKLLESEGCITLKVGCRSYEKKCSSYIFIEDKFKKELVEYLPRLNKKIEKNCLILRKDDKNIEYMSNDFTQNVISNLKKYNSIFLKNKIHYSNKNVDYILKFNRIFNGGFESGGRYYESSGLIQNLSSIERGKITINGNNVIEADFKHIHMSFLYDYLDVKMPQDFDPYLIEPEKLGLEYTPEIAMQLRKLCKSSMCTLICSKNYAQCYGSIKYEFIENKKSGMYSLLSDELNVHSFIKIIKEHNFEIGKYFHSGIGLELQRKDSDIAELVINHFTKKDVVVIPIHDSFIVEKQYEQELKNIMIKSHKDIMGSNGNCRVEVK